MGKSITQIVGQYCVLCHQRVSCDLDAQFCGRCGCPVHTACRSPIVANPEEKACQICGAPREEVDKWKVSLDDRIEREQIRQHSGERGESLSDGLIWSATDGWFHKWFTMSWYQKRGSLSISDGVLRFHGKRDVLRMKVTNIELIGPVVARSSIVKLILGPALCLIASLVGMFQFLTTDNPVTYFFLGLVTLFLVFVMPMLWIRVSYLDEHGNPAQVYFTTSLVLKRWLGGVNRLYLQLRKVLPMDAARSRT